MLANVAVSAGSPQRSIFEPAYLRLFRSGELAERARLSRQRLENCDLCARYCRVNRRQSSRGAVCRTAERAASIRLCRIMAKRTAFAARAARARSFFLGATCAALIAKTGRLPGKAKVERRVTRNSPR